MLLTAVPVVTAEPASSFLANLGMTLAFAAVPIVIIAGTSFLKISIVLALLRSAVGAQDVPPTLVITALAAVLTMFVMAPVAEEMALCIENVSDVPSDASDDPLGFKRATTFFDAVSPSLIRFLKANTSEGETAFYMELAGGDADKDGLRILLPAFATGEIIEAFLMGFLIFLPFLVVDLIVSTTLVSLGFNMLSPAAAALPLKLLLLTAVDGWHIILNGLLMSYGT